MAENTPGAAESRDDQQVAHRLCDDDRSLRPDLARSVLEVPPGQWWSDDGWLRMEILQVGEPRQRGLPEGWVWVVGVHYFDGKPVDWCTVPVRIDNGRNDATRDLFRVGLQAAVAAGEPDLRGHVLAEVGAHHNWLGLPEDCLTVVCMADGDERIGPAVRCLLHGVRARAHATQGDRDGLPQRLAGQIDQTSIGQIRRCGHIALGMGTAQQRQIG